MAQQQLQLPKGIIGLVGILIVLVMLLSRSIVTIDADEAGIVWKYFGGVNPDQEPLGDGVNIVAPWNKAHVYKVRQQSISDKMNVLSVNGLEVGVDGTVWFKPEYNKLGHLHKTKGKAYINDILGPAINAAARSVVGRYTPEQLYSSKRDIIENEILVEVSKELSNQYIIVERVLVEDVTLPPTIKEAIERKLKQEQESLEYEFRLVTADKEAQKQIIEAEGKAESNRILSASLTDKILQDKGIDATIKLAESDNSKVIVIGGGDKGLPLILGNN